MNHLGNRVLIVDDIESNRYVVGTWLRRAGYHVVEARTGEEALQKIDAQPFDLAVLDVNLPDMTGYAICEYIKQHPATSATPVLHMSATATNTTDRSEGLRRGAEGYLVEPVEREELLATVEALLRAANAHKMSLRLADRLRRLHDATLAINEMQDLETLVGTIACEASKLFAEPAIVLLNTEDAAFASTCGRDEEASLYRLNRAAGRDIEALPKTGRAALNDLRSILPLDALPLPENYLIADLGRRFDQMGRILIGSAPPPLDEEQVVVLAQLARVAGAALHNSRMHDVERRIAVTLQRGLLPETIPPVQGFDIAVRYEASAVHAEVGGDFYDVFEGADGRLFLAIGDVAGHSLEAATIMAQLRTGFRSYALEGHGPVAILDRLNELLMRFHLDTTATVCCGWLDPQTGECVLANAGHVPPLLVRDGVPQFVSIGGTLLGFPLRTGTSQELMLNPGDRLVFYTDGLVERRRESIEDGLARLADVASHQGDTMDAFCERAFAELRPGNVGDDVAIMAIQRLK